MLALGPGLGGGVLTGLRQHKTPEKGSGQPGADSKNSKNSQENSRSRRVPAPLTTTQKGWFVGLFVCLLVSLCPVVVYLILL